MHPDITSARHKNNPSSNAAWEQHHGRHANARQMVLDALMLTPRGLTSKDIAERLGWDLHKVSPRLSELKRDGKIEGAGERRNGAEVLVAVRKAEQMSLLSEVA